MAILDGAEERVVRIRAEVVDMKEAGSQDDVSWRIWTEMYKSILERWDVDGGGTCEGSRSWPLGEQQE